MDKYRRGPKKAEDQDGEALPNEVRITKFGKVHGYVSYATNMLMSGDKTAGTSGDIVLKAMGGTINKAVTVAEILKHRIPNMHTVTNIFSVETEDVYEPLEEGLDIVKTIRRIPGIKIQLALNVSLVNLSSPGYQKPIPLDQMTDTLVGAVVVGESRVVPLAVDAVAVEGEVEMLLWKANQQPWMVLRLLVITKHDRFVRSVMVVQSLARRQTRVLRQTCQVRLQVMLWLQPKHLRKATLVEVHVVVVVVAAVVEVVADVQRKKVKQKSSRIKVVAAVPVVPINVVALHRLEIPWKLSALAQPSLMMSATKTPLLLVHVRR
ncbi:hypothetical protein H310_14791 [Aphanomyces invadans]|uniref:DNA/RNA-binding protein Alba-like domain-containing protein n=1 Tax=Aphanomyces invadans TaxID=157072 RepID=A0A024T8U0_9STRA|nr:hypothetical protein H310_14791 [Aphanomyces invadans]ETV90423.1 hypothetical protein H310_14791 [Aphanomyces invadans]|eukprot:XP_008880942.1 hypothetical protein H310_14791 [Aphanomyces invadans]